MKFFHNPIIPGFYPDPSITSKGEDFYLVTSSFYYFPGIPLFHSRDLVHWEQVGNVVERKTQADLATYQIYAATIRYRKEDDTFYVVTTLVKPHCYFENINLYYTAKDPCGPWSEPHVIKGAEGIDPTLVFEKGDAWYLGNLRPHPENETDKSRWIWLKKLDLRTGMLIGERHILRKDGALHHADTPEGAHIYHTHGWYYLLIAEGGTKHNHAVSVFRSKQIEGPYEENPRNPVLTSRHLAMCSPIHSVGHADIIETAEETWAVCLGVRPCGDATHRSLGRETFLVPVIWENGWPVFAPDTGRVMLREHFPDLKPLAYPPERSKDDFRKETKLGHYWVMEHSQVPYQFSPRGLTISGSRILRRVRSMHWRAEITLAEGNAGIILLSQEDRWMMLEADKGDLVLTTMDGKEKRERLRKAQHATMLSIEGHDQSIQFQYREGEKWKNASDALDGSMLSNYFSFTGNMVGITAKENGTIISFSLKSLRA